MKPKYLLNLVGDRLHTLPLVVLYLTDGCNSRCVTCDIWRNPRRNMKMELVEEIASTFQDLQVRWVLLSGGEAMQHPKWPEIGGRFKSEGTHVMLLTNGLLLRKQADELVGCVDEVIVSLDGGTASTYDAIRGVDAFDLILDGIREVRARGIPVSTRTTLQRANFREVPQIIEAAKSVDVNRVSFLTVDISNQYAFGSRFAADPSLQLVANMGGGAPPEHGPAATALTPQDVAEFEGIIEAAITRFAPDFESGLISESPSKLRSMVKYFSALSGETPFPRVRCNSPHVSTVIEVDGKLRPCYFLPTYGQVSAALPLNEAINSSAAQALREAYRTGKREECERCVCPLYKGPRALLRM
ncbi:MAG: radical SAM protein [Anaerolineaceae bacterium]|nr:radical SAM protein [Anaerolineaceae bacterium]